jgi:hypothetical protein
MIGLPPLSVLSFANYTVICETVVLLKTTWGPGNGAEGTEASTNITALLVTLPIAFVASTFTFI